MRDGSRALKASHPATGLGRNRPVIFRPSRMLRPRSVRLAAPATSSSIWTMEKAESNSPTFALEARNSAEGMITRSPFAAITCMRFIFVPTIPVRRLPANPKPEPPVAIKAGMSTRNPHDGCFNRSDHRLGPEEFAEGRREPTRRNCQNREHSGKGMDDADHGAPPFGYATQMSGTATFWNKCGAATAEAG